jgi:predicted Rossmann fold nucleotide-binding protein DprA/Smf involved in DNA uptake
MVQEYEILEIRPPTSLSSFLDGKPKKLWCSGEPGILIGKLLGVISARQIDSDLALKSSRLLKQLACLKEVSFIGGWHSPLEEEALHILSADSARIVFCVSKALHRFVPSLQVKNGINDGRVLLLTHCSPKAKRISRDASLRRNQLVVGMAGALLVLSAPEGSASLKLARSALRQGKPVYTLEHRLNKELLASGALPATLENIQTTLR